MLIKPFQAYIPKQEAIGDVAAFIDAVKEDFSFQLANGQYQVVTTPHIYIYEITHKLGISRGIVALNDPSDILAGKVLKHEQIIADKTTYLKEFIIKECTMLKPIMAIVDAPTQLRSLLDSYVMNAPSAFNCRQPNGEKHTLYQVTDKDIQNEIIGLMALIPKAYIADGHHRYETYLQLLHEGKCLKSEGVLMAFFSKEDMRVLAYHRGLRFTADFDFNSFLTQIKSIADVKVITSGQLPQQKHSFVMNYAKTSYQLILKAEVVARNTHHHEPSFDVEIIAKELFYTMLDITDNALVDNLAGSTTGEELYSLATDNYMTIGLYPIDIEEVINTANNGEVLPAKSTWFEPKIRSGVIVARW